MRISDLSSDVGSSDRQVESLIHRGVPPENIVVVGFSKGGDIAIHVSSFLRRPEVRFVLLAACWPRPGEPQLRLTRRVLSFYEKSDSLAGSSCEPQAQTPEQPQSFRAIHISQIGSASCGDRV